MKLSYYGLKMEKNDQDWKRLLKWRDWRPLPDFEECMHAILSCVAYETLVKEEEPTWSTPDAPHLTSYIRRITIKISPVSIQDTRRHAPHTVMKIRRISRRCTNILEYNNLGPHVKLTQCAASTYSMRRILPQTETINTPRPDEFRRL